MERNTTSLFTEGQLGSLTLKNRIMMAPMVRNYVSADGRVTPRYIAHIARIARGGVGALIMEASYISPEGRGFVHELGLHEDGVVPGLRALVAAAHDAGAKIGIQLYHGGRQTGPHVTGMAPVAPSAIADPVVQAVPRALETSEVKALVKKYGDAAVRAKEAGFDFVEIHGAHGYLITQFLSAFTNTRTDEYGGSFEKRLRFANEVCEEVQSRVGLSFPVVVRLSADEMVEGGISVDDTAKIAQSMVQHGADAIHVSVGNYASYAKGKMIPPMAMKDGVLLEYAAAVKRSVRVPVIAVGKLRNPADDAAVISRGDADFIALGRTLLADPEWPNKVREGKVSEIMPCIACNAGCISRLFAQQDVWCTVNPEAGREEMFAAPAHGKKKVVVVGGGPAGMSAAKEAAKRGHEVVLYEEQEMLGGQLFAAEAAPLREGWREFREALTAEISRLPIDVRLRTSFSVEAAQREKPDVVILATGADPVVPAIAGSDTTNVLVARDILEGKVQARDAVAVIGGGCAGAQAAEFLVDRGHKVTVIEAGDAIAVDAPMDERVLLLGRLAERGVSLMTHSIAQSFEKGSVRVMGEKGESVVAADTVVLCLGSRSRRVLEEGLRAVVLNVLVVGDAVEPRRVTEAVAEGALAALSI